MRKRDDLFFGGLENFVFLCQSCSFMTCRSALFHDVLLMLTVHTVESSRLRQTVRQRPERTFRRHAFLPPVCTFIHQAFCPPPVDSTLQGYYITSYVSHQVYIFKLLPLVLESLTIHDPIDVAQANKVIRPLSNPPDYKRNGAPWHHDYIIILLRKSGHQAKMPFLRPAKKAVKKCRFERLLELLELHSHAGTGRLQVICRQPVSPLPTGIKLIMEGWTLPVVSSESKLRISV